MIATGAATEAADRIRAPLADGPHGVSLHGRRHESCGQGPHARRPSCSRASAARLGGPAPTTGAPTPHRRRRVASRRRRRRGRRTVPRGPWPAFAPGRRRAARGRQAGAPGSAVSAPRHGAFIFWPACKISHGTSVLRIGVRPSQGRSGRRIHVMTARHPRCQASACNARHHTNLTNPTIHVTP